MTSSILLACAVLAAQAPSVAGSYQLFPVSGVFFPMDDGPAIIDPDFKAAIGPAEKAFFAERFRARFPQAVATITEGNQRRTYAVSLQIARASKYLVEKIDGTTDMYLPVTASLYFSNVMTGEVLYAETRTTIRTKPIVASEGSAGSPEVVTQFAATFRGVVDDLVGDAQSRFRPTVVSARGVQDWKGLAILDGGRQQGISRGDSLSDEKGNEVRVISAGPTYAIGTVELGSFVKGSVYAKVTNRTLAEIQKPRVLPIVEAAPPGFAEESLVQLFTDALGSEAPVSLVPVNRTFGAVVKAIGSQIDLSKEKLTARELPNFFVRLSVLDPVVFERPTNIAYKTLRVTTSMAHAEVVDRAGRVLHASVGRDRVEEEITQGMALNLAARKEIAVKNALLDLAKQLASGMKFENVQLEVAQATPILVRDPSGFLLPGATMRTYRNLGRVDGINGDVRVPTWDVEVTGAGNEGAVLATTLPVVSGAPVPAAGDVVILDGVAIATARRMRMGGCGGPAEQLGAVTVPDFGPLALNVFASKFPAPFYASGLASKVNALVRGGTGFRNDLQLKEPAVDFCVQPVNKIEMEAPACTGSACAEVTLVKLTFRFRKGSPTSDVSARTGMESRMTAAALPKATAAAVRSESLRSDLLEEILKIASATAAAAAKEKL